MAYGWAVAFATLYALLTGLASWGVYFLGAYSENMSPAEARSNDWLMVAAVAMFVAACVFFAGVVLRVRLWLVVPAFLVSGVAGVAAVWYALVEASDQSDVDVIAFAVGCGLVGALAVVLSTVAARRPSER